MQTQQVLSALGIATLGIVVPSSVHAADPKVVNNVTEVRVLSDEFATRITIVGSQSFTPEVRSMGKVTMVTLPGVWQAGRSGTQRVGKNGVTFVRYGQFTERPSQQVRIVANHSASARKGLDYTVEPSENQTRWEVVIYSPGIKASTQAVVLNNDQSLSEATGRALATHPIPGQDVAAAKPSVTAAAPATATVAPLMVASLAPVVGELHLTPALRQRAHLVPPVLGWVNPYPIRTSAPQESVARPSLPKLEPPVERPQAATPVAVTVAVEKPKTVVVEKPKVEKPKEAPAEPILRTPLMVAMEGVQRQRKAIVVPAGAPKKVAPSEPLRVVEPAAKAPAPSPAPAAPPRPAPPVTADDMLQRTVTLDFVNAELADVIKAISVQSKVNVVSGNSVTGKKVTLALQKVQLRDALDWISRMSGLRYTLDSTNTVIVGTGQEISLLKRTAQTPDAMSSSIPFLLADENALKIALEKAYPNVTITIIGASAEAKEKGAEVKDGAPGATSKGEPSKNGEKDSDGGGLKPRGGTIYVVGTRDEVMEIRRTVDEIERGLLTIAQREEEHKLLLTKDHVTETYEMKYVSPSDAAALVKERVPGITIKPGPRARNIATALGGSAAYQAGGGVGVGGASGGSVGGFGGGAGGVGGAAAGGVGGALGGSNGGANGAGAGAGADGLPQNESRVLLITGKPEDIAKAKEMLAKLDVKVPLLIYEAQIVEVNQNDLNQLGLTYDLSRSVTVGENNNGGQPGAVVGPDGGPGRRVPFGAIFRTPYSITGQLQALLTNGKANILARPQLTALDGNQAMAFVGDQIKYVISQQQTQQGANIQTETASVGITLRVTGRSNGDGTMTLYVHPEVSTISSYVTVGNTSLPQIASRFFDTTVRVKDGDTFAIGGLVRKEDFENVRAVPGFSKLPFVGALFRSTEKRRQNAEVMVFITCRLSKD